MNIINERLNIAIKLRNIKPADLVKKTNISKGAISSYMSGNYVPKSKNIYKLAKALNVNESWLLGYDVPMEEETKIVHISDYYPLGRKIFNIEEGEILQIKTLIDLLETMTLLHEKINNLYKQINEANNNFSAENISLYKSILNKFDFLLQKDKEINKILFDVGNKCHFDEKIKDFLLKNNKFIDELKDGKYD